MAKPKSKKRMVSLGLTGLTTILVLLAVLGIRMLVQGPEAADAAPDEALRFDAFNPITPLTSRTAGLRPELAPVGRAEAAAPALKIVNTMLVSHFSYVPPPRIPYRPRLRSPFRPPI